MSTEFTPRSPGAIIIILLSIDGRTPVARRAPVVPPLGRFLQCACEAHVVEVDGRKETYDGEAHICRLPAHGAMLAGIA